MLSESRSRRKALLLHDEGGWDHEIVDLRASKTIDLRKSHRLSLYADIFNLMNANTVLTRQDQQQ